MLAFNVSTWSTAIIGSVLNGMVMPAFSQVKLDVGNPLPHSRVPRDLWD